MHAMQTTCFATPTWHIGGWYYYYYHRMDWFWEICRIRR